MFDAHIPEQYRDRAPKIIRTEDGSDVWDVRRREDPQHRAQRRGRPPQGGVRHRADRLRRDPPRLLGHRRAHQGHERRRRARLDVLPVVPRLQRPPVRRHRRQGPRPRRRAGLQRLARRRVVRHLPRPLHPDGPARAVGRRAGRRRGAPPGQEGRALAHLHREPGHPRLPELPQRLLGPAVEGAVRRAASCCRSTSARRASWPSPRPTPRST